MNGVWLFDPQTSSISSDYSAIAIVYQLPDRNCSSLSPDLLPRVVVVTLVRAAVRSVTRLSRLEMSPDKMAVRPAKTQINLGIRPVWSESSLCAQCVAKDPSGQRRLWSDPPSLILVFAGRTLTLLVLSCPGSNIQIKKYASPLPNIQKREQKERQTERKSIKLTWSLPIPFRSLLPLLKP